VRASVCAGSCALRELEARGRGQAILVKMPAGHLSMKNGSLRLRSRRKRH